MLVLLQPTRTPQPPHALTAAFVWTLQPIRWSPSAATSTVGLAFSSGCKLRPHPLSSAPSASPPSPRIPWCPSAAVAVATQQLRTKASTSQTGPQFQGQLPMSNILDSISQCNSTTITTTATTCPHGEEERGCSAQQWGECWEA